MFWVGLLAVAFFVGAVYNAAIGDWTNSIVGFAISAIILVPIMYSRVLQNRANVFLVWLSENLRAIERGSAYYEGTRITLETEVTQFQVCVSLLIVTNKIPTQCFIVGHHNVRARGLVYSLVTLLLGWWGIWGLIYTPQTLWRNLNGGYRQTVAELIGQLSAASNEDAPLPSVPIPGEPVEQVSTATSEPIPGEPFITAMVRGQTTQTLGKVVRIGDGSARINEVTREHVLFADEQGNAYSIKLEECNSNWIAWLTKHQDEMMFFSGEFSISDWDRGCVVCRGKLDNPPWVGFTGEPETRFEFHLRDALDQGLLNPLFRVGWHTFDTN